MSARLVNTASIGLSLKFALPTLTRYLFPPRFSIGSNGPNNSNRNFFNKSPSSLEMIVYRDIISEDEVLSDAFKLSPVVDKDGAVVRRTALICKIDKVTAFSNFLLTFNHKYVNRI
jgi:Translationally controlled tumour protein